MSCRHNGAERGSGRGSCALKGQAWQSKGLRRGACAWRRLRALPAHLQVAEELAAGHVLHDEVHAGAVLEAAQVVDQAWVRDQPQHVALRLQVNHLATTAKLIDHPSCMQQVSEPNTQQLWSMVMLLILLQIACRQPMMAWMQYMLAACWVQQHACMDRVLPNRAMERGMSCMPADS